MSERDQGRPRGFDVDEAAQLAAEVQELGFDAAHMIVDRFVELFEHFRVGGLAPTRVADDAPRDAPGETEPVRQPSSVHFRVDDGGSRRLQADAQRALESYLDVLRHVAELGLPFLEGAGPQPRTGGDGLELPDLAPGGQTSARLWIHNSTGSAAIGLRPWTSGLLSHDGSTLGAHLVTFRPDRIDRLDPGASAELLMVATTPQGTPVGLYHGQILVEGLPATAFPVSVRVVGNRRAS
jgi:hypothetical protein